MVVGAGVAGLTAAFRLQQAGCHVRVLERTEVVGGRCRSVRQGGYLFDVSAGALPSTYTHLRRLLTDLGLEGEVQRRGAVIGALHAGRVERIARRNPLTLLPAKHLTARDKLSLWRLGFDLARMFRSINYEDLSTAGRFDTMTVREYCDAHYSPAVRDRLLAAVTRALLLVEPEQSSVVDLFAACKSLLVAGSLLTHPQGVGFFVDDLAGRVDVHTGAQVTDVLAKDDGAEVHWEDAEGRHVDSLDACVLAVPAPVVLETYRDLDDTRRSYLAQLEYSACIMVQLGVREAPNESASMVLVPRDLDPDLAVVGLGHNLGPDRAPAGAGVLTAFWMTEWSRKHALDSDDELRSLTTAALERLFPGWPVQVETSVVTRWDPAVVASRVGTFAGLAAFVRATDPTDRVQLAGDFHAQSSVNASIAAGELAAARLINVLG
jgi:oxygen-dependent protoporphyrinogen oxidase